MTESPLAVLDCYSGMGRAKIWALVPTLQTELERARISHVILVVNDGSTDDTRDVCSNLRAKAFISPRDHKIAASRPLGRLEL